MTIDTPSFHAPLLLLHLAATFYMVGLVWFVQRVHYPLFAGVGAQEFPAYQDQHVTRTSPVVGPAMLIEAGTGLALVVAPPPDVPQLLPWLGLALLTAIWLSTWLLQVPRHGELTAGFDPRAHRRLVASNWIRTAAWSIRGGVVFWMMLSLGGGVAR